ncbi:hypothetical protein Tco_0738919 [Tanacetum coccineum]
MILSSLRIAMLQKNIKILIFGKNLSHRKVCVLTESLHRVIESFIVSYRNRTYRIIATEFAYWASNIESMEVNSESNPLERKDAEGPSLDESLENEEHLMRDSDDSVLYNDGGIKDAMEKNLLLHLKKNSINAPPSYSPGYDLNIDASLGSSWIDNIGPLT